MNIALLHTAQVHADTFDNIFDNMEQQVTLTHHVAPGFLSGAQALGLDAVRSDTLAVLSELVSADAVICTCTTIGPLAEEYGRDNPHVFRIDAPMMQAACESGPGVLVAICLESTRAPTMALLDRTATDMGANISPEVLFCDGIWALFESGQIDAFSRAIAEQVRTRVARGGVDCVVLAQASMRDAEAFLGDLCVPVLSSPEWAAQRAVEIARTRGS